jgi:hypothetical protein
MKPMTKDELNEALARITGGDLRALPLATLRRLITVTQYSTDVLLNEIEERGELTFIGDAPVIPYIAEHEVETILTR